MKKPASYYENLPAAMVDMNDPDVPESVKIRAQNEIERHNQMLKLREKAAKRKKLCEIRNIISFIVTILTFIVTLMTFLKT